ncbi:probable glutathione S-transferase MSR-1 [Selaginella moellendorffii]|uniref:probable glutathione S-transferase MSR-1 n=1 Tax=Selaginella moellendorffii TaxID=88036 RepID=UPI000D1C3175|nr:probable glutathione S-transferase MSR-1 [Selaginella moellendorffii]|eukprot:XP_024518712.1 probable glutathione S-transferase MSR-1 [Selaginella moellendorffii]
MAEVTLLSLPASPFAMSVKMALIEKGVEFATVEENYRASGKSELLVKVNPVTKQVPVLLHRAKPIWESLVILEYVEETWKAQGTQLLPGDGYQRALARFWSNFVITKFWETGLLIMKRVGDEQLKARDQVLEMIRLMDSEWSKPEYGKPFVFGDKLSLADLALAPIASWKVTFETLGKFEFPDARTCPRMALWLDAIENHPTVQSAILAPDLNLENANIIQKLIKDNKIKF